jgi:hypothetical protein
MQSLPSRIMVATEGREHGKQTTVTQYRRAEQTISETLFPRVLSVIEARVTVEGLARKSSSARHWIKGASRRFDVSAS